MDITNYILSIDPGAKGFLCVLHIELLLNVVESVPMPVHTIKVNKKNRTVVDEDSLSKLIHYLLKQYNISEIVIEKQRVQANEGVVSTGSTMQHFGWLKGFSEGKQIKKTVVTPKEWQNVYPTFIPIDDKLLTLIKLFNKSKDRLNNQLLEKLGDFPVSLLEPKEKSKLYCSFLFPKLDLRKTTRCKGISDGKTDSILIGVWRGNQLISDNLKAA